MATDSLSSSKDKRIQFTEKDIKVDQSNLKPIPFNPNFKEKYQSNEFQYETVVKELSWWDRFIEWLKNLFKRLFGLTDGVSATAVNWTLNIIATIIVLVVIYLIAKAILNKEGQWVFGKSTSKKIITHNDIERNLKYTDFEKLILDTLKLGDKRLAIRYYYLWILKKMSEKSIIEWNPEKTNSDYSYEIKSESLKKDFDYISYLYNYIWYGEFDLDEKEFNEAKKIFEKTLQSI